MMFRLSLGRLTIKLLALGLGFVLILSGATPLLANDYVATEAPSLPDDEDIGSPLGLDTTDTTPDPPRDDAHWEDEEPHNEDDGDPDDVETITGNSWLDLVMYLLNKFAL